ncbi:MAG: nucleotidyltransferase domain-containing protein [Actinobacteria bacterium]|nr:nucleotidyltransferase domain-containing protein [Actinomycetota bacterium]MBU1944807.1 nucleotidyltransferase domain-containing protein [Actinomycetota bacterium]MBU2687126.1 nucleotidyltransferase domain-containing protein [Actinomycetota bacterium]
MRVTRPLDDLFDNPNNVKLLRHLSRYPSPVITGRGLARELGMSHATCIRALDRLVYAGIVDRKRVGSGYTYEVATSSVIYQQAIKPAFDVEAELLSGLIDALLKGVRRRVHSAYLFGSVARREDTPSSDVDVLVLTSNAEEKKAVTKATESNREGVYRLYRVGVTAIVYDLEEFNRKRRRKDPLVSEVLKEGILVAGRGAV